MSDNIVFIENSQEENRFLGMSCELLRMWDHDAYRWDGKNWRKKLSTESYWPKAQGSILGDNILLRLRHAGDPTKGIQATLKICYGGNTPPDSRREPDEHCMNRPITDDNFLTSQEAQQLLQFAQDLRDGKKKPHDCPPFLIPPIPDPELEIELQKRLVAWMKLD